MKKLLFVAGLNGFVEQNIRDDCMALNGQSEAGQNAHNALMTEGEGKPAHQEMLVRGEVNPVSDPGSIVLERSP